MLFRGSHPPGPLWRSKIHPRSALWGPNALQERPRTSQGVPRERPGGPQEHPGAPQERPRDPHGHPRETKSRPRRSQKHPEATKIEPKSHPGVKKLEKHVRRRVRDSCLTIFLRKTSCKSRIIFKRNYHPSEHRTIRRDSVWYRKTQCFRDVYQKASSTKKNEKTYKRSPKIALKSDVRNVFRRRCFGPAFSSKKQIS